MQKPLNERASTSPVTGVTPGVAGRIADSPVVELLAYAYNQRFDGLLELRSESDERPRVAFLGGRVDAVIAPSIAEPSQRVALESHLPPETLQFAQEHARAQASDLLTAVEVLHLLPPETRHLVRAECVTSQIIALCRLRGETGYAFVSGEPQNPERGLALSLDPLALIVSCILAEPALDRARRAVQAFQEEPLTLVGGHEIDPSELRGVSRACIKRLQTRPHSFTELERLQASANDEVTALVYALFLTGAVALRTGPSEYPRPMHHSHVPRSISSHGMRAVGAAREPEGLAPTAARAGGYRTAGESEHVGALPNQRSIANQRSAAPGQRSAAPGQRSAPRKHAPQPRSPLAKPLESERPTRHDSGTMHPPSSAGDGAALDDVHEREKVSQECEAEAKVVNAWMMGEADRTFLEKARVFSGKVVKLFPKNPRIRYCFACLEKRAGNTDSAIREFARVLEIEPGNVDARNDLDQLMKLSKAQRRGEKT